MAVLQRSSYYFKVKTPSCQLLAEMPANYCPTAMHLIYYWHAGLDLSNLGPGSFQQKGLITSFDHFSSLPHHIQLTMKGQLTSYETWFPNQKSNIQMFSGNINSSCYRYYTFIKWIKVTLTKIIKLLKNDFLNIFTILGTLSSVGWHKIYAGPMIWTALNHNGKSGKKK